MEQALIGLVGLLLGILLNEYFRRRNRVEAYSAKVFERRLQVYEGLMKAVREAEAKINDLLDDKSLRSKERQALAFQAGLEVMQYTDDNFFFLNDEITVHTGAAFVGVGDLIKMPKGEEREKAISDFHKMLNEAKEMIRSESGLKEIDEAFRSVTKAKHGSSVIDYYRKLKAERDAADRQA